MGVHRQKSEGKQGFIERMIERFGQDPRRLQLLFVSRSPTRWRGGNAPGRDFSGGAALLVKRRNSKWSLPPPGGGSGDGGQHFSTRPGAALPQVGALFVSDADKSCQAKQIHNLGFR